MAPMVHDRYRLLARFENKVQEVAILVNPLLSLIISIVDDDDGGGGGGVVLITIFLKM